MTPYDVLVVGGGPAASAFVLHLAQQAPQVAARTLVLEKYEHPREKYCAGAISAFGMESLAEAGYALDVPHVPLDGFRVRYGETATEHGRPGMGVVIRRDEFDHSLWRAAGRVGADLRDGQEVVGLSRDGELWEVRTKQGEVFRARVLVGADGAGSRVRKLAAFKEPRKRGRLYVLETPVAPGEDPLSHTMEFDLGVVAEGIEGYYWDFPILLNGQHAVSRGIYHMNTHARKDLKQVLGRFLSRRGIDPEGVRYKPFSERGYAHGAEIARHGILLVGEAAGIDAVTGEGIAHAVVYARVAAEVVSRGLQCNELHFQQYGPLLRSTLMARHLKQSSALAPWVYGKQGPYWASFLASRENVVAACAKWYEGRPLSVGEMARIGGQLAVALSRRERLPYPSV